MVKIGPCSCTNEYQDKKYGKNNRVHNSLDNKRSGMSRCAACGKESCIGESTKSVKK